MPTSILATKLYVPPTRPNVVIRPRLIERLYLALSTVKGHSRVIFEKLQVQRRTEAVARARGLGLL